MVTTRTSRRAFVEVTAAMAIAGSSVVPAKVAQAHLPLFLVSFASFLLAFVAVLPLQLTRLGELKRIGGRQLLFMLLQSLFGMVLFRIFLLLGLARTSAVDAGIIMGCGPAVTIAFGVVVFRERPSRARVIALALSVAGIASIYLAGGGLGAAPADAGNDGGRAHRVVGDLLVLCAIVSESLLTVFRKMTPRAVSSITNTTVLSFASLVMTLPLAAGGLSRLAPGSFTPEVWLALVYYGAFVTVTGYLLWGDGALHLPAGMVGIATGAMPLSSTLLSTLLLGERLGPGQLVGCLFVVASILLAGRGDATRPPPRRPAHGVATRRSDRSLPQRGRGV